MVASKMVLEQRQPLSKGISIEIFLFSFLTGLYLIPLFLEKYTLTDDGPAHLYNALLLKNFWDGNIDLIDNFYQLNHHFSTNWIGHVTLALLMYSIPAALAEKIILLSYIVGLPLTFRYALTRLNPNASIYSLLIFPFLYSQVFMYGFYNQSISFILLFLFIGKWISIDYYFTRRNILILTGLVLLILFSHPLTFLFSALISGAFLLDRYTYQRSGNRWPFMQWKSGLIKLLSLPENFRQSLQYWLLIYAPAGLLFVYFILSNKSKEEIYIPHEQLDFLWGLASMTTILDSDGSLLTQILFSLLSLTLVILLVITLRRLLYYCQYKYFLAFVVIGSVTLVLYLFMPERIAGGFIIRPRIGFLFCTLIILIIATYSSEPVSDRMQKSILLLTFFLATGFLVRQIRYMNTLSMEMEEILTAERFIPSHAVVLPYTSIEYDTRLKNPEHLPRHFIHISNYLCLGDQQVCLHNYQAQYNYFPINGRQWDFVKDPVIDQLSPKKPLNIAGFEQLSHGQITHVVLIGTTERDPKLTSTSSELASEFHKVYTSAHQLVTVYERNSFNAQ
ncbi:hypothetical protein [Xanthocytophaga flava]|uniref:hypothetical protein n=1 Tax=Xanthocytophaga flava TaxID=3048013 RepID=UPI0028D6B91F|nr:hypothetical protein [Xanthocytophaga flavus]MDJ1471802.1 hypothetical protein [Xanthocytophaga flavus]